MKKLKIYEQDISSLTTKKSVIGNIHNITNPYTTKSYSDDHWQGITDIREAISSINGINDVSIYPENGGYRENNGSKWKEYKVEIETVQGFKIGGVLNAHSAGTVEDPFSRYDMTINFW